jgi:hypothetical protein
MDGDMIDEEKERELEPQEDDEDVGYPHELFSLPEKLAQSLWIGGVSLENHPIF